MKNLDFEKSGPRKTWSLKNWTLKYMNSEKHGINMRLKNMADLIEFERKREGETDRDRDGDRDRES